MPVQTNRLEGQIITAADINNIAAVLNAVELAAQSAFELAAAAETPDGAQAKADAALTAGAVKTAGGSTITVTDPLMTPLTTRGARTVRAIAQRALAGNVVTLTTAAAHDFIVGRTVTITGIDATFNGTYRITSTPTPTTFTYARVAPNVPLTATPNGSASSYTQRAPLDEKLDSEGNPLATTTPMGGVRYAASVRAGVGGPTTTTGVDLLLDSLLS